MTRKGSILAYNNTIYNAGAGAGVGNNACFAVQVTEDITSTFPHATLVASVSPGSNVVVGVNGLCGYGTACTGSETPVQFEAGQNVVIDTGSIKEEAAVEAADYIQSPPVITLGSVTNQHAAGASITGANGNVGMTATNNICEQPLQGTGTVAFSMVGKDEIGQSATIYVSGSYDDCYFDYAVNDACPSAVAYGSHNIWPKFVSVSSDDFHLASQNSGGYGAGTASTPWTYDMDADGAAVTSPPSMGAYQQVDQ
jgi:hypothetical protein